MRSLTGSDYDDENAEKPKPEGQTDPDSHSLRLPSYSSEYDDEGTSMEHPIKNEIEVKGIPMPYGYGGGYGAAGMGADGFGMGGAGGLLVGALLGRGLLGGWGGVGVGAAADTVGAGRAAYDSMVLAKLGDIQTQVPVSAGQVQNTVAAAASDITSGTLQQTINLGNSLSQLALGIQGSLAGVKDAVQTGGTVLLQGQDSIRAAVNAGTYSLASTIRDDGDKTRALISQINLDALNRQLTVAENTITELRLNQGRRDDQHGIEIQMINNQSQNQLQFQAQAQAMGVLQHGLFECNQLARATNQNVLVGNSGTTTTGPQTANPTNVRV